MQTFETHKSTTAAKAKQEQPFFRPAIHERQATSNNFSSTGTSFFQARPQPVIQAKLQVNTPGDSYEQQADAVADQVMRMRDGDAPIVQRMPLKPMNGVMRMCSECAASHEEEKEVQRKESGGAGGQSAPPIVSQVLAAGGGQAMDSGTRQFMESRFGQDFSAVRIHTDSRAAESASAIQARAYTSGNNVVFGAGEYQPGSEGGRRLLAHELVHVGQQGSAGVIQRSPGSPAGGCGLCYGSPKNAGIMAHLYVQAMMLSAYPYLFSEFPFYVLPAPAVISGGKDESGRLDLIDVVSATEINIGEIKPDNPNGWRDGERDLRWYTSQLAQYGIRVGRLNLSPMGAIRLFPTGSPDPECMQQIITVNEPINGIYTYHCEPDYAQMWMMGCTCTGRRRVPVAPPVPVPVPAPEPSKVKTAAKAAAGVGAGYLIYRGIRMIPSLFPPLWGTIPANAAIP
jgi:Domain of unknown function (DUF4157)/Toxin with a conserved tryptophan and TIP tripeptide motif